MVWCVGGRCSVLPSCRAKVSAMPCEGIFVAGRGGGGDAKQTMARQMNECRYGVAGDAFNVSLDSAFWVWNLVSNMACVVVRALF